MHYQLSDVIPRKHERSRYRRRYDDCQVDRAKTRLRMLAWVPHGWFLRCSTAESWELERNKGQIDTYHVSRWFRILSNVTHYRPSRAICDCSDPVSYVILPCVEHHVWDVLYIGSRLYDVSFRAKYQELEGLLGSDILTPRIDQSHFLNILFFLFRCGNCRTLPGLSSHSLANICL